MKLSLIATTMLVARPEDYVWQNDTVDDADELAEMAGRLCYESWDRPNPATASNDGYLANILNQRHFSVLEHASATIFVEGVSRAMLLELERHRHFSFSVVSQRYVDHGFASAKEAVVPPIVGHNLDFQMDLKDHMSRSQELYDEYVEELIASGHTRKEARGAARAFLPEATETSFFITGNMRAWREMFEKRNNPHADAEIREFAKGCLEIIKDLAPNTFQDME